jgi:hypothetical protein
LRKSYLVKERYNLETILDTYKRYYGVKNLRKTQQDWPGCPLLWEWSQQVLPRVEHQSDGAREMQPSAYRDA